MDSEHTKIKRLENNIKRFKKLLNKHKLSAQTQHALIQLSEQASTVSELSQLYPAIHQILDDSLPTSNFFVALLCDQLKNLELSYFVDEKDHHKVPLQAQADNALENGLTGYVFKQRQTQLFTKKMIEQYQTQGHFVLLGSTCEYWLGVPIKRGEQVIGVMVTQSYSQEAAFTSQHIALFETISTYLSTAIDRVKKRELLEQAVADRTHQLKQEVNQHKETLARQTILFKISELATQCQDINSFYQQIHKIIADITYAKNFCIVQYDKQSNILTCPYSSDETRKVQGPRAFANGLSELVISTKNTHTLNANEITSLINQGKITLPKTYQDTQLPSSWVGAPLLDEAEVIGIIVCQSYQGEYEYNQYDADLMTFISQQIANVMSKYLAFEKLELSHHQLEHRVDEKTRELQRANLYLQLQIEERKKIEQQLYHDAHHDNLTGLANRSLFISQLEQTLQRYHRSKKGFAVLFVDLDNFKEINDTLGHQSGDRFLKKIAKQFSQCIREHDVLARFGGDEFVILLTDLETPHEAQQIAARVTQVMNTPYCEHHQCIQSGASIGIAYSSKNYLSVDEVIRDADAAMYHAKQTGKGHIEFFQPMFCNKTSLDFNLILDQAELSLKQYAIIDSHSEQQLASLLTPLIEHPELGKVRLDKITHHIKDISYFLNLLIRHISAKLTIKHPSFINISSDFLNQDVFEHFYGLLQHSQPKQLVCLLKESELRSLDSQKLKNFSQLTELGIKLGLSNVARSHVDLTLFTRLKLDYLMLSNAFCQRAIKQESFKHQLVGLKSFATACGIDLIGSGPSISSYHKILEPLGLDCWVSQLECQDPLLTPHAYSIAEPKEAAN